MRSVAHQVFVLDDLQVIFGDGAVKVADLSSEDLRHRLLQLSFDNF